MDSYSEVRRVRMEMSAKAEHDIRVLIASINSPWPNEASRAIDLDAKGEQGESHGSTNVAVPNREIVPAEQVFSQG